MQPRPIQRPHPPIWIGGNSPRAIRRAVDFAQGWSPFPLRRAMVDGVRTTAIESLRDLGAGLDRLHEYAASQGRETRLDVNFVPFGLPMNVRSMPEDEALHEQLAELGSLGVTWVSIGMPTSSRTFYLESVDRFAETFIRSGTDRAAWR